MKNTIANYSVMIDRTDKRILASDVRKRIKELEDKVKVADEARSLQELIDGLEVGDSRAFQKSNQILFYLKELQSLRKIDIAYTLKYAEESGAVCEEMKYCIEQVIKEIKSRKALIVPDKNGKGVIVGLGLAEDLIDEHLTQYLDLEENDV